MTTNEHTITQDVDILDEVLFKFELYRNEYTPSVERSFFNFIYWLRQHKYYKIVKTINNDNNPN